MKKLGLIGFPLGHSFSKKYYEEKMLNEGINTIDYDLYPIETIAELPQLYQFDDKFCGFNVTIPHKEAVLPYIDELSDEANAIHAVNCVRITRKEGRPYLKGFNTDAFGFEESLKPLLRAQHSKALIFGNGGAAKAVVYVCQKLGLDFKVVSRAFGKSDLTYGDLNQDIIEEYKLLINCSPLGTFPNITERPNIPYDGIGTDHLLYDLIYNPEETSFLAEGRKRGALTKNGYQMLVLQAEKNWEIWHDEK